MLTSVPPKISSAMILTASLCLLSSLTAISPVLAAMVVKSHSDQLTPQLVNTVRLDLSHRVKIPAKNLKITGYTHQVWPDGCLGLPKADEFCTQALVQGWRITLSDGRKTWAYRTDHNGRVLRLENHNTSAEL